MDTETADTGSTLTDRLNRIPVMTRTHWQWLFVLAVLLLVDMADLNTFAYAAPAIRENWNISVGAIGTITGASFLGMFVGSVVGGRIADRFGRKRTIIGATLFFSFFSLISAASVSVYDLAVYRVLTGVGLATMTVVVLTYVSEMFPQAKRGRSQTLITAISLIGIPIMAWVARLIVPLGPEMWRWIFILGGIGIPLVIATINRLPESVRWLEQRGQSEKAEHIVVQIEEQARKKIAGGLPPIVPKPTVVSSSKPTELLSAHYRKRTIVLAIVMALALSSFYGYNSWIPTLLTEHGFDTHQSLVYTSLMSLAAVPGALLALFFIDRINRRTASFMVSTAVACLMLIVGFSDNTTLLVASGTLVTMLLQTGTPIMYTYMPEIFPTNLRALGTGLGNGVGRIAVFGTSFLIAAILSTFGFTAVFIYLAAASLLAGLIMRFFGERTKGRTLEDIVAIDSAHSSDSGQQTVRRH